MRLFWIVLVGLLLSQDVLAQSTITAGKKALPLPGHSFRLDGHDAFLILPKNAKNETPWVWYAPTLRGLPAKEEVWMFKQFLQNGIAIGGIDVGESYGSPAGREVFQKFYNYVTNARKLNAKPVLLARSRGGLMLYNWAVEHPQSVNGIAGIYPVCNITSYPGVAKAAPAYRMSPEKLQEQLKNQNPVDRLAPLAAAKVPVFHIHGDVDKVVPLEQNSALLKSRYNALGAVAHVEIIPQQGHNMWQGWFRSESLTKFVIERAHGRNWNANHLKPNLPTPIADGSTERVNDIESKDH